MRAAASGDPLTDGLSVWFKLDEGSGAVVSDSSANSYTGTLSGDVSWGSGPPVHVACGGVAGQIETDFLFAGTAALSVAWKFRTTSTASENDAGFISGGAVATAQQLLLNLENGQFWGRFGGNTISSALSSYNDGNWHSAVFTKPLNGTVSDCIVYIDGSAISLSTSGSATLNFVPTLPMRLFRRSNSMEADLYDVRVYDRVLSASEAAALYAFAPTDLAGLGLWYRPSLVSSLYQDGAGTTPVTADGDPVGLVVEQSGNSADGTPVSALEYDDTGGTGNLIFEDGDRLTIADVSSIDLRGTDFTVAAWFRNDFASGIRNIFFLGGALTSAQLQLDTNGVTPRLITFGAGTDVLSCSDTITQGQWHFVCARFDASSGTGYISIDNGAENSLSGMAVNNNAVANNYIGYQLGQSRDFIGAMGNIYIYQSLLTPSEVALLYQYGR